MEPNYLQVYNKCYVLHRLIVYSMSVYFVASFSIFAKIFNRIIHRYFAFIWWLYWAKSTNILSIIEGSSNVQWLWSNKPLIGIPRRYFRSSLYLHRSFVSYLFQFTRFIVRLSLVTSFLMSISHSKSIRMALLLSDFI